MANCFKYLKSHSVKCPPWFRVRSVPILLGNYRKNVRSFSGGIFGQTDEDSVSQLSDSPRAWYSHHQSLCVSVCVYVWTAKVEFLVGGGGQLNFGKSGLGSFSGSFWAFSYFLPKLLPPSNSNLETATQICL